MKNFFTADTHLGHANVIIYCNRPQLNLDDLGADGRWKNHVVKKQAARAMDTMLIDNHNSVVNPEDTVWHLGDYSFGHTGMIIEYLRRMNGTFKFLWGNHDESLRKAKDLIQYYDDLKDRVQFYGDVAEVTIENQFIVLNHYAMKVWNHSHKGSWHLYGHSHGSLPDDPTSRSFDVGVDCHNYFPLTFQQVADIMAKKQWKPVDHHGQK